jgi:hypothetical protein
MTHSSVACIGEPAHLAAYIATACIPAGLCESERSAAVLKTMVVVSLLQVLYAQALPVVITVLSSALNCLHYAL